MEAVVPWDALISLFEPHYPKASKKGARPPYPLAAELNSTQPANYLRERGLFSLQVDRVWARWVHIIPVQADRGHPNSFGKDCIYGSERSFYWVLHAHGHIPTLWTGPPPAGALSRSALEG
jgi:hypothetical protein